MTYRSHNQRDANQPEIVAALRERGAYVVEIEHPLDLLVGFDGAWCLVEVKSSPKAKIRPSQKAFVEQVQSQNLPAMFVRTMDDLDHFFPRYDHKKSEIGKNPVSLKKSRQSRESRQPRC